MVTSEDKQLEEKARVNLEHLVSTKKIFIDTCSLLMDTADKFWKNITPYILKYNNPIYIPLVCINEIEKLRQKEGESVAEKAKKLLTYELGKLQEKGIIKLIGERNDNPLADNVLLTQFTRYKMDYDLLLITQDHKLGKEILDINKSEASKGKMIEVRQINQYGFLSFLFFNTPTTTKRKQFSVDEAFPFCTDITQYSDIVQPISQIPIENDTVLCGNGEIRLLERIGGGGEGDIYKTNTPYVAKVYKKEKITKRKVEKLKYMLTRHIQCEGVCYPVDLIYNVNKEFVGYLMPPAKGKELQKSLFIKPLFKKNFPTWKKRDTVELCITILEKIKYLNERNIILGDINPANILIVSPKEVYFVDTDSYQVGEFPCPVGTVNFTAPEIQRKKFSSFLRTKGNEQFAIATLLFMIMIPGKPPYAQQGGDDPISNIIKMDFSYPFGEQSNGKTPDGPWRFIWSHLTYDLKMAFYNTFMKNGIYSEEKTRLNAAAWLKLFATYLYLLDSGKYGQQDKMSEELYPTRFKKNPKLNYGTCKICKQEFEEHFLNEGICQNCLKDGEIYHCEECGKEMIYTNYIKYIRKKEKHKLCPDCYREKQKEYAHRKEICMSVTCKDCHKKFGITYGEYDYYVEHGLQLPERCSDCRKKRKDQRAFAKRFNRKLFIF